MSATPYNPLDKANLARSIESALLARAPIPLSSAKRFTGAGVYALYYTGAFEAYAFVASLPVENAFSPPVYVGKAIPAGGRIGVSEMAAAEGNALTKRLGDHRRSIKQAENLDIDDFWVRYLLVDDVWIPLGESILIQTFRPTWNVAVPGFGNNAPGRGREKQVKSPWDVLHPGRTAFKRLPTGELTSLFLHKRIADHIRGRPLDALPLSVRLSLTEGGVEGTEGEAAEPTD